jgi:hypothetical protein
MVCNATFNNISVISWRSVLLVKETGVYSEKITNLPQITDKLYVVSSTPRLSGIRAHDGTEKSLQSIYIMKVKGDTGMGLLMNVFDCCKEKGDHGEVPENLILQPLIQKILTRCCSFGNPCKLSLWTRSIPSAKHEAFNYLPSPWLYNY